MPYVIKLLHPNGERLPKKSSGREGKMDWAINHRALGLNCGGHRRKFLSSLGRSLTSLDGKVADRQIMFWGEWEPPSCYKKMEHPCRGMDGLPRYSHTPSIRYIQEKERGLNTDPYVLGKTFYYSCCQQKRLLARHDLPENSIILFGSQLQRRFILDTVFVVERAIETTTLTATAREAIIAAHPNRPANMLLFSGKMRTDTQRELFSFFPCLPSSDTRGFARPTLSFNDLDLANYGIHWADDQKQGFACTWLDDEMTSKFWHAVIAKVFFNGLNLGVYAEEPVLD